jgi:hypothetical protein
MARHPVSDERSVLPSFLKGRNTGRIYLMELARFLRVQGRELRSFLRRRRLLHFRVRAVNGARVGWTTPHGVAAAIVHFRAKQAEMAMRGLDPFAEMDRAQRGWAVWKEQQAAKAAAKEHRAALVGVAHTTEHLKR